MGVYTKTMSVRIFNVKKDGSYTEVPANPDSLEKGNGAFIIVSRKDKNIYVYHKPGISRALAYAAARAATNLNTRRSSKYKIINLEPEERKSIISKLFPNYFAKTGETREAQKEVIQEPQAKKVFVVGETSTVLTPKSPTKAKLEAKVTASKIVEEVPKPSDVMGVPTPPKIAETAPKLATASKEVSAITQIEGELQPFNIQDVVKALASRMLFELNIGTIKKMRKPPKDQLRAALIKEIDALLEEIYY